MKKILITGGSGTIGTRLTQLLRHSGYDVVHLGRTTRTGKNIKTYVWDVNSGKIDTRAFEGVSTIVHLAGANIGDKPWSEKRKREILESRTRSTRLLFDTLKRQDHQVSEFVSASAIGYYGLTDEEGSLFTEEDGPGDDYLADVVRKWEHEVDHLVQLGLRVVKVRVGIVLSKEGGALSEIAKPVKYFVGAPLGTGNQMLSWIHLDDLCRVFVKAIEDKNVEGALNAVGPEPVSNKVFTKAIAKTLGRPLILPAIPSAVIRLLIGEMSDLALKGNAVSNAKLMKIGFQYQFNRLEDALKDLLIKKN